MKKAFCLPLLLGVLLCLCLCGCGSPVSVSNESPGIQAGAGGTESKVLVSNESRMIKDSLEYGNTSGNIANLGFAARKETGFIILQEMKAAVYTKCVSTGTRRLN